MTTPTPKGRRLALTVSKKQHTSSLLPKMLMSMFLSSRGVILMLAAVLGFVWLFSHYSNNSQQHGKLQSTTWVERSDAKKIARKEKTASGSTTADTTAYPPSAAWPYLSPEHDTHERFWTHKGLRRGPAINDIDFLWQYDNSESLSFPNGILFVAHGCSHSMTDWWPSDGQDCPECIGLPEERAIVETALDLGLLVVAMSSLDRSSKCWSSRDDGPRVAKVLQAMHGYFAWRGGHDDDNIKILAFGASSGGHFVSTALPRAMSDIKNPIDRSPSPPLPPTPRIHGYISQIAAGATHHDESSLPAAAVFLTMNRDERTDQNARQETRALDGLGVAVRHVRLDPLPLTDGFFSSRIPQVDTTTSRNMVQALKDAGMLLQDEGNTFLAQDPRRSDWRSVLAPFASAVGDSMVADQSALAEVLNVAWGMHEMSRDSVKESLEFLLSQKARTPR